MFEDLHDDNFLLFCAKAYDKPNAVTGEFEEDLNRVLYIKRLLTKYYAGGALKDRLIMNHLIVLYNVFGMAATRILFFKLDLQDLQVIKPFLIFIRVLPEKVVGIRGKDIETASIRNDEEALLCLVKLKKS